MKPASNKRAVGAFLLIALLYLIGAVLYGLYVNFQNQAEMIEEVDGCGSFSLKLFLAISSG